MLILNTTVHSPILEPVGGPEKIGSISRGIVKPIQNQRGPPFSGIRFGVNLRYESRLYLNSIGTLISTLRPRIEI